MTHSRDGSDASEYAAFAAAIGGTQHGLRKVWQEDKEEGSQEEEEEVRAHPAVADRPWFRRNIDDCQEKVQEGRQGS
jgi:hypothetical protein